MNYGRFQRATADVIVNDDLTINTFSTFVPQHGVVYFDMAVRRLSFWKRRGVTIVRNPRYPLVTPMWGSIYSVEGHRETVWNWNALTRADTKEESEEKGVRANGWSKHAHFT